MKKNLKEIKEKFKNKYFLVKKEKLKKIGLNENLKKRLLILDNIKTRKTKKDNIYTINFLTPITPDTTIMTDFLEIKIKGNLENLEKFLDEFLGKPINEENAKFVAKLTFFENLKNVS